ncbi:MFS general substrate transporter [Microthyrium microscopicum]|uniref:MFS general substrate transporter n=1 Tax=Microthyrium microscopicum TaxID=703497 RepID=A0A6A6UNV8_9PEZI|nr:MFS general substrate transporter [Microthyrium microscopicum]
MALLEGKDPGDPFVEPPHHVFSREQKKWLVYMVSLAAMFSPLSSNIYFPALPTIAETLHTPIELVTLTITIYMLFQGLAPSFWGPLADQFGRRPILIATLCVYILANLGLGFSKNYASLMVFRGIQAIGSSATIAIGAGVIGDVSVAAERGGFMGHFAGTIGPVFGGVLAQFGFRSIFWFLLCLAVIVVVLITLFLPETLRSIAGDGSRQLYGIYRPLVYTKRHHAMMTSRATLNKSYEEKKLSWKMLLESFRLLAEKDVFVTLMFGGIIYTIWSMQTSSTSSLFTNGYHLSSWQTGLIFLPNGIGCMSGSFIIGKIMDSDYAKAATQFRQLHSLPAETELKQHIYPSFSIERARLKSTWWLLAMFCIATGLYGFALQWHMAVPLTLQFITAFTATAIFNINSTLMIDLYPSKASSATAVNNLVRCTLGGLGVALIEQAISRIHGGITFLVLAVLAALSGFLVVIERTYGPRWREQRLLRGS